MTVCPIGVYHQSDICQALHMNDIAVIHLYGRRGGFAVVDADMFETLNQHRWCLDGNGYPASHLYGEKGKKFRMHRVVNGTPPKVHTDHRNGFKIDNTRRNLRSCSYAQNMQSQKVQQRAKTSQFKGVSFVKVTGKWMAYIGSRKTRQYLGSRFQTERDAAAEYNKAASERYGEYALLNVI